jgi:hypothetical protein
LTDEQIAEAKSSVEAADATFVRVSVDLLPGPDRRILPSEPAQEAPKN